MKYGLAFIALIAGSLLALAMMLSWERPPMAATQLGPRGTGMVLIQNPRTEAALKKANIAPESDPPATLSGIKVKDSPDYQNVKVLGDLDVEEFNRLMGAISNWIAPDEGCTYCHNPENMADDSLYTKVVARRMLQMTKQINSLWTPHVQQTGVTCYTCHRGHAVPANIWFKNDGPPHAGGMSASRQGEGIASKSVGMTSLPYDPFSALLVKGAQIRVDGTMALASDKTGASIHDTEVTYGLMIHMSEALGVNCTFCHNSRQFASWPESRPQRVTAWHGLRMVSDVNETFMASLQGTFPKNRLGPMGDVAKINCATCHQGVNKPLYGVSMAKDYPELRIPNP
jgi:photosynthetic reaction center cytochrome c subunit